MIVWPAMLPGERNARGPGSPGSRNRTPPAARCEMRGVPGTMPMAATHTACTNT